MQRRKQRRKCCGMSIPVFILVLIVTITLIAAAVLIPIFLILVPKQHKNSNNLSDCAASNPCRNGGKSIVSNNACVCVCSNSFTGDQCQTSGNTDDCMTITLNDGPTEYKNATIGSSILPSLTDASTRFNVPLNVSTILSLFSTNNLTCTSENSIVDFNSTSTQGSKSRRYVIVPGLEPQPHLIQGLPSKPQITARAEVDCPGSALEKRQQDAAGGGTSTQNGIVFQASTIGPIDTNVPVVSGVSTVTSATGGSGAAPTSTTASASESASATSTSASASSTATSTVSDQDLAFARVVVLFVLQESHAISVAVTAQQRMETFLGQTSRNSTVDVGFGDLTLEADFNKFEIVRGDGQVIGS
jgi:hypothetical protein